MKNIQRRQYGWLLASSLALFGIGISFSLSGAKLSAAQAPLDQPEVTLRNDFSAAVEKLRPNIPASSAFAPMVNAPTTYLPFPHMVLYGGPNSSGWPMVGSLADNRPASNAPLNEDVMNAYARFPHVILPATPLADTRPDILSSLHIRNPNIKVTAYVMGHTTWCPEDVNGNIAYAPGVYYRDYYLSVTGGDPSCASTSNRFLWMQDGIKADMPPHNLGLNVNLAHRIQNPDLSYTYDVAEAIASTMYEYARAGRGWDGIFIDVFCPSIIWLDFDPAGVYSGANYFDYSRAGYSTGTNAERRTAFDLGWQAGHQRLADRLRELAVADGHPDYQISGNCAQAPERLHASMNGWMRENFPYQNGGTFYSNMLAWPWGMLHQDRNFKAPAYNYIFTAANWNGGLTNNPNDEQYNTSNQRKMRYGLGSATLSNGWSAFHAGSGLPEQGYWFNWWYDEYGVNTTVPQGNSNWGKAMNGAMYTGWLGQPLGDAYQMIYPDFTTQPDILTTNQGFETAGATPSNIVGWYTGFNGGAQVTITRDTTTAAEGSASVKYSITQIGTVSGNVSLGPITTFPLSTSQQHSITFWAKASSPRPIEFVIASNAWPATAIPITTEWRRYQVQTNTVSNDSSGYFYFVFGQQTGDVWIDDVHVQTGSSSVYRRDFSNGIVLVNPTENAQTVTLEKPYRKILGTVNPTINDGSQVTSVTIPGTNSGNGTGDALFLLNLDLTPPSQVTNLSVTP